MEYVTLGKTGLKVNKNGFGALPIQRATFSDAEKILKKAFENGINFLIEDVFIQIVKKK